MNRYLRGDTSSDNSGASFSFSRPAPYDFSPGKNFKWPRIRALLATAGVRCSLAAAELQQRCHGGVGYSRVVAIIRS
jgi:hypothetical protein